LNPTFQAGFWHEEDLFRKFKGVTLSQVGYARGGFENPTYEDMCTDKTGRVEAAEVEYGPSHVSYEELLDIFWKKHSPATSEHNIDLRYSFTIKNKRLFPNKG
jgi:peptide-methionine (S)-S-oxide reductase